MNSIQLRQFRERSSFSAAINEVLAELPAKVDQGDVQSLALNAYDDGYSDGFKEGFRAAQDQVYSQIQSGDIVVYVRGPGGYHKSIG